RRALIGSICDEAFPEANNEFRVAGPLPSMTREAHPYPAAAWCKITSPTRRYAQGLVAARVPSVRVARSCSPSNWSSKISMRVTVTASYGDSAFNSARTRGVVNLVHCHRNSRRPSQDGDDRALERMVKDEVQRCFGN